MALVPETGAGLPNADALVDLAFADSYLESVGRQEWAAGSVSDREAAIRRASGWASDFFLWKGRRTHGREQALAWPRTGVTDREGLSVPSDEVPIEVRRSVSLAALAELLDPGFLSPEIVPGEQAASVRVGPIAVSFREPDPKAPDGLADSRPVLTVVEDMLRGLVASRRAVPFPVVV